MGCVELLVLVAHLNKQTDPVRQRPTEHEHQQTDVDMYRCWEGVREEDADGPANGDEHEARDDGVEAAFGRARGVGWWKGCDHG
jgi:hypothetical protein